MGRDRAWIYCREKLGQGIFAGRRQFWKRICSPAVMVAILEQMGYNDWVAPWGADASWPAG